MQVSISTRVAAVLVVMNIFNDILPTLAQGSSGTIKPSEGVIDFFVSRRSVRNTWVAFWILWFIWSIVS